MQRHVVQELGWYGVVAILAAYGLSNFHILNQNSFWYILLNLTGAIAIAIEAATKRDRQPMVLNLIWAAIALVSLVRLMVF